MNYETIREDWINEESTEVDVDQFLSQPHIMRAIQESLEDVKHGRVKDFFEADRALFEAMQKEF